jgi:hypothetical protein
MADKLNQQDLDNIARAREVGPALRASTGDRDRLAGWLLAELADLAERLAGEPYDPCGEFIRELPGTTNVQTCMQRRGHDGPHDSPHADRCGDHHASGVTNCTREAGHSGAHHNGSGLTWGGES